MFSEQGLDLVDVNVSDQSEGQAFGEQQREGRGGHSQGEEEVAEVQPQRLSLHLVDSYVKARPRNAKQWHSYRSASLPVPEARYCEAERTLSERRNGMAAR